MLDSGALEFEGDFGASSQILVVGSRLVTTWSHAIAFRDFHFSANLTLLLLDNHIEGYSYAVYFTDAFVVDGGVIIVRANTLSAIENKGMESSVYVYAVDVSNGGYFDVENNTMRAVNGVYFFRDTTVSSAGLLRVAYCTFVENSLILQSALVHFDGSVTLEGGAQWRVEGNNVNAASVIGMPNSLHKIKLSGSGTTVVVANNRQVEFRLPLFNFS
ncbi:dispersed gene family protein 1 (DGF-1), putative, partial [Trypanosoma cruzi marinkellei]